MIPAENIGQEIGGFPEDPIPFLVSLRIIDVLEVVQVQHHDCDVLALAVRLVPLQRHSVANSRQCVRQRQAIELFVFFVDFCCQRFHFAERPHFRLLEIADQQHVHGNANQGHAHLLQVFRCKMNKAVICGEKEQRIKNHDHRRHDPAAEAKQGGAENEPGDQDHVWVRYMKAVDEKDQRRHNDQRRRGLVRQIDL